MLSIRKLKDSMSDTPLYTDLQKAIELLRRGDLVGMPTETVYGLAGDARNSEAVAKIYTLKNRPAFNPLIAHVDSLDMATDQAVFSSLAMDLAGAFWPGPITLVLPVACANTVCDLARAGLDTQALRWPKHPVAQALISSLAAPIVAPSANKSGRISPTSRAHVQSEFGSDLQLVLEGQSSGLGLESTVLAVLDNEVTLLRPGSLSREDIEKVTGPVRMSLSDNTAPKSPGMLSRHYAPRARLKLNQLSADHGEAFLGFGKHNHHATLNLSEAGNLTEAAANLYAMLRDLDEDYDAIAVAPIPEHGLGEAINDRLRRASLSDA